MFDYFLTTKISKIKNPDLFDSSHLNLLSQTLHFRTEEGRETLIQQGEMSDVNFSHEWMQDRKWEVVPRDALTGTGGRRSTGTAGTSANSSGESTRAVSSCETRLWPRRPPRPLPSYLLFAAVIVGESRFPFAWPGEACDMYTNRCVNERTSLTRPLDSPDYVEFASLLRSRKTRIRQFQCCICATLMWVRLLLFFIVLFIVLLESDEENKFFCCLIKWIIENQGLELGWVCFVCRDLQFWKILFYIIFSTGKRIERERDWFFYY